MTKAIHLIHRMLSDPVITKTQIFDEELGLWDVILYKGDKGFFLSFGGTGSYRETMRIENMNIFLKLLENTLEHIRAIWNIKGSGAAAPDPIKRRMADMFIDSDEDSSDMSYSTSLS